MLIASYHCFIFLIFFIFKILTTLKTAHSDTQSAPVFPHPAWHLFLNDGKRSSPAQFTGSLLARNFFVPKVFGLGTPQMLHSSFPPMNMNLLPRMRPCHRCIIRLVKSSTGDKTFQESKTFPRKSKRAFPAPVQERSIENNIEKLKFCLCWLQTPRFPPAELCCGNAGDVCSWPDVAGLHRMWHRSVTSVVLASQSQFAGEWNSYPCLSIIPRPQKLVAFLSPIPWMRSQ